MKRKNKIITVSLCAAIALSALTGFSTISAKEISVELDGRTLSFDVKPQLIDGRTMVPLRTIFEEIGALVKWDGDTQTASARKSSKTVTLSAGSSELTVTKGTAENGDEDSKTVALDVPAQLVSGRTLVPVRAISEAFGLNVDWDSKRQTVIITSDDDDDDDSWKDNTGTINLSDLSFSGRGIEINGNQILITEGGDFTLTGTLSDGSITVSCDEKVKLRLSGVSVSSSEGPCIFIENADKAYITITEDTENTLSSASGNTVYSKDNLEIKGKGKLNLTASGGHGIKASDNLTIENGSITINAANDGIHVNDTFKMTGGSLDITADGDGIDSESIVNISDGEISIKTCGIPVNTQSESTVRRGGPEETADVEFESSSKGINAEWMMCISGGEITVDSASHAIHCQDEIQIDGGIFSLSSEYEKGISAHGNLTINGEDTVIDIAKSTEGLESKNILTVNDGTIKIFSTDDAVNATGGNSGSMGMGGGFGGMGGGRHDKVNQPDMPNDAENRWEKEPPADRANDMKPEDEMNNRFAPPSENGESNAPQPDPNSFVPPFENGGNGGFTPPDGNNFKPDDANRPNGNDFKPDDANRPDGGGRALKDCLIINGGYLELYAEDDCLDSNGNLIINGGTIKASNPTGTFSGPFAVIDPDGSTTISENAELIFAAGGGDVKDLKLSQNTIVVYCEASHNANELISVTDSDGNIVLEYAPQGSFSAVLISSGRLVAGQSYTVTIGEEAHEATLTEQSVTVGTRNGSSGMGHGQNGFKRP